MARYVGGVCKFCRREKLKLFLKGERCFSDKCAVDRKPYPPGEHGHKRVKFSPYGEQLREKQKAKRIYGLAEKQFRLTFARAKGMKGITGDNLFQLLERRLDNMVYRMGFARTRREARLLVRHGHFILNNSKVNIPSILLKIDDEVQVRERSQKISFINASLDAAQERGIPAWIELERKSYKAKVKAYPQREDISMPIQEQMIVELYSK